AVGTDRDGCREDFGVQCGAPIDLRYHGRNACDRRHDPIGTDPTNTSARRKKAIHSNIEAPVRASRKAIYLRPEPRLRRQYVAIVYCKGAITSNDIDGVIEIILRRTHLLLGTVPFVESKPIAHVEHVIHIESPTSKTKRCCVHPNEWK